MPKVRRRPNHVSMGATPPRRLCKPKEAAGQQAMFVDKKVDPGAPAYSLNYLRVHPEISMGSIPWHMHSDLVDESAGLQNGK